MIYGNCDYLTKDMYRRYCQRGANTIPLRGAGHVLVSTVDESFGLLHSVGKVGQGVKTLISYDTPIMDVCEEQIIVNANAFDYSNTTCRHISLFLSKYVEGVDYYTLKKFVKDMIVGECVIYNGYVITVV